MRPPRRFVWLLSVVVALLAGHAAWADTIILKNGRRIVALNVVHEGDRVTAETRSGTIALPASLVERIEKDGLGNMAPRTENLAAGDFGLGPPSVPSRAEVEDVAAAVIRDGAVDRSALAAFHAAVARREPGALARAAAGETAAGQFEVRRGNTEQALAHLERALSLTPDEFPLLLNVAYLHLERGEHAAALEYLDRARRTSPDSPDLAKLAGWAYYGQNRLPQAIAEWRRAQQLRPDEEVARALARAERDLEAERNFREGESQHFVLRYYGGAAPELARAILQVLERDFREISVLLDYRPPDPIGVVLYTNEAFTDTTRAPNWAGAVNDGRIRIPVQGLATVTPQLAAVLRHELAHSIVAGKTRGRCPVWLQEGVAQWIEGQRARDAARELLARYDQHQEPSLSVLEGPWMNLPDDYVGVAYGWSLAVIEYVATTGGPSNVERLLGRIAAGATAEAAAREVLRLSYDNLNRMTGDYLRRTYGR